MRFAVRNLIITKPSLPYPALTDSYEKLLADCKLWWGQYGIDLDYQPTLQLEADLNTITDEPWPQVAGWWQNHPDYDINALTTVFLGGWDSQKYIGWGGRLGLGGLSVVGDYAIDRILSRPTTPDDPTDWADANSIVDDWQAGGLYCHELGHTMGLPHDFTTDGAMMGYQGRAFNSILGEPSEHQLNQLWTVRESDAYLVSACKRPT